MFLLTAGGTHGQQPFDTSVPPQWSTHTTLIRHSMIWQPAAPPAPGLPPAPPDGVPPEAMPAEPPALVPPALVPAELLPPALVPPAVAPAWLESEPPAPALPPSLEELEQA